MPASDNVVILTQGASQLDEVRQYLTLQPSLAEFFTKLTELAANPHSWYLHCIAEMNRTVSHV